MNSKVGFIFGALAALCMLFTYFFVPECRGRTLEQVDHMFRERVPLRHFHKHDVSVFETSGVDQGDMMGMKEATTTSRHVEDFHD